MKRLLYLLLASALLSATGWGLHHYLQAREQNHRHDAAIQEIRAATITYLTDLAGGMNLATFEKHLAELKILFSQDQPYLSSSQQNAMLCTQASAETVQEIWHKAYATGNATLIRTDERLTALTREEIKTTIAENGRQVITCQAANAAADWATKLLNSLAQP